MTRRGRPRKSAKTMVELQVDDIFTNFPDHIVHLILKFLSLKDLSRLSCASRRCRKLCIFNPYLSVSNIHYTEESRRIHSTDVDESRLLQHMVGYIIEESSLQIKNNIYRFFFTEFVGRLLTSRILSGVKTHTFCLQWSFGGIDIHKDENWKVRDWVYFIVNHPGLETLHLELTAKGTTQSFDSPLCVFSCNSLTQLIVKCKNVILEFPPSALSAGQCVIYYYAQVINFRFCSN